MAYEALKAELEQKLAELLGHTRLEVFMGMLMGIVVAMLVHAVMGMA